MPVLNGTVAFSNINEFEEYKGKSIDKYTLTISVSDDDADKLASAGVKIKTYTPEEGEPMKQRKFSSKYKIPVVNEDGEPMELQGELPYGSKVRILWKEGQMNPQYGLGTYLNKIKVLELADVGMTEEEAEEF